LNMRRELSSIPVAGTKLRRDGSFEALGTLFDDKKHKLVSIDSEERANLAARDKSISSVVTLEELANKISAEVGVLVSNNPTTSFYEIHNKLAKESSFYGELSKSIIDSTARVHPTASIAKNSVYIGRHCRIGPNATIGEKSVLGNSVAVGPGTVVGCDPGASFEKDGVTHTIVSTGGVTILDHAEIDANCRVSRAIFGGNTVIGEYTMIDNLVTIGENVQIGRRCLLVADCAIGPNTHIEDDVWIGPKAVIRDNLTIGKEAFVAIGSVVGKDVKPGTRIIGNFVVEDQKLKDFLKKQK
jgi:UDP-3-O-[3-hydroxymyristoyl] glucosamine N-acyltransferase